MTFTQNRVLYLTYFTLPEIQRYVLPHMDILECPLHVAHVQMTPKEETHLYNSAKPWNNKELSRIYKV